MTKPNILIVLNLLSIATASFAVQPIPFQLEGKLIIMRAAVNGQTGNFILDTGVSNLVLNARYFEGVPTDTEFRGLNGQAGKLAVCTPDLEISGHHWKKVYAEVVPMQGVESSKGIPIHGLLGTDLFRDYILLIDYQVQEISLFPVDKTGYNPAFRQLPPPFETLPFKSKSGTPLITAYMGSKVLKLTIDTGAEINLIGNKYQDELGAQQKAGEELKFGGFGAQTQHVAVRNTSAAHLGALSSGPMRTAFVDLNDYNRYVQGPLADGIVGYELLSCFRVAFNFKKRELYLWEPEGGLRVGK